MSAAPQYPPAPVMADVVHYVPQPPLPDSVTEVWDEATQRYTYTFSLDKDERDALVAFGLHPRMEVDSHVVRRAPAIMRQFAHDYATQCFHQKKPLDCYCERTLFRRVMAERNCKEE